MSRAPIRQDKQALVDELRRLVMNRIDTAEVIQQDRIELRNSVFKILSDISAEKRIGINLREQQSITTELLNDIVGLGPLEQLINDDGVNDILVNGPNHIYVERAGKLQQTPLTFRNHDHVLNVARRIASRVGRRIDEASPMVDARLEDGSRVNIIIPPLARSGVTLSIRKFPKHSLTLETMVANGNLSADMAYFLQLAVQAKLNLIISGGTGTGKTTLLNAISVHIGDDERIVTIEDAAELQLQQSHVVSLETRAISIEGTGEVSQRDLLKNALRMRPDRVILGEVRGGEVFDMLQAMNTGHDGSISTVHANTTQDAIVRLENMLNMGSVSMPPHVIRKQIASSVDLVVQIERSLDGNRRVIDIAEVESDEQGELSTHSLFHFTVATATREAVTGQFQRSAKTLRNPYKFIHAGLIEPVHALLRSNNTESQES